MEITSQAHAHTHKCSDRTAAPLAADWFSEFLGGKVRRTPSCHIPRLGYGGDCGRLRARQSLILYGVFSSVHVESVHRILLRCWQINIFIISWALTYKRVWLFSIDTFCVGTSLIELFCTHSFSKTVISLIVCLYMRRVVVVAGSRLERCAVSLRE